MDNIIEFHKNNDLKKNKNYIYIDCIYYGFYMKIEDLEKYFYKGKPVINLLNRNN